MNKDEIHLKCLCNIPIEVEGLGTLKLPTIRETVQLGEMRYQEYISKLLFSKENLVETNEEIENHTDFEILISLTYFDHSFRDDFFHALDLFFDDKVSQYENGIIYLGDLEDEKFLTEESLSQLQEIIKIANFIEDKNDEEEIVAGNEKARKFMEKLKKKNARVDKSKKQKVNMHSLISALAWKSTKGIEEILNLNIYQLYDGYRRIDHLNNYHYTLTGMYSGTIDGKSVKLPDINWANIIKIN